MHELLDAAGATLCDPLLIILLAVMMMPSGGGSSYHGVQTPTNNQPPWGGGGVPQGAAPGASGEEFGGVRGCASPGAVTPPGGKKGPWGGLTMLRANHG